MKKIFFVPLLFSVSLTTAQTSEKKLSDTLLLETVEITSVRADDRAPFTKTNVSREEISKRNVGTDLPFVLNNLPSVVATSDAGNGVGYTGIRIRGSDATRINITLNGIPYNDAESQGVFFVNMPDIASSLHSVQVQRGVGTSANGAGAFGATINLSTNEVNTEKYLEVNNSFGSFNTLKNTFKAGSGLLGNRVLLDGRFSRIVSDGYQERGWSNLHSFLMSAAWLNEKNSLRLNIIGGNEKTYQSWGGVPESMLKTNRRYNSGGTEKPGEPYDNETDNFAQTHYQLFYNRKLSTPVTLQGAVFLTRGMGYYETYKASQKYSKYGLPDVTIGGEVIKRTDLIRQKWLDNYLYGSIVSLKYEKNKTHLTMGGGWNGYDGGHHGLIKWAEKGGVPLDFKYYDNPATKKDGNMYAKWMQALGNGFTSFADAQVRFIRYEANGFSDNPSLHVQKEYVFFNPKAGVSYLRNDLQLYASLSLGTHEPNRNDFEAGIHEMPSPERLYDWELGFEAKNRPIRYGATVYFMDYRNQLINTGKINDVGALTRVNVPKSYRAGIELEVDAEVTNWFSVEANMAFSKNKIREFIEYIDNYDAPDGTQKQTVYKNTDISYSPNAIGSAALHFIPAKDFAISLQSKYVGKQYLDNTQSDRKMLEAYYLQNVQASYTIRTKSIRQLDVLFQVNNLLNNEYVSNGYTFSYISGGELSVNNFYFPMAGIHFMATANFRF